MEKGRLIIETFASNAVIPLSGSEVYVTSVDDSKLLAYRKTDLSGRTEEIELDTPDKALSQSPNTGEEKPFTSVNVYTRKEGYFNTLLNGVQVFATELSIQRIQMLPLPEFPVSTDLTKLIVITPQNL